MFGEGKSQEETQVTIRNLPNEASQEDILSYLEIAGPIKSHKFYKDQQRYSASVVYHDQESAQLCRKNLGDRYYRGRALTIELKRTQQQSMNSSNYSHQPQDDIVKQIYNLRRDEVRQLLGLLHNVRQGEPFFDRFLESRPKLTQALLAKSLME